MSNPSKKRCSGSSFKMINKLMNSLNRKYLPLLILCLLLGVSAFPAPSVFSYWTLCKDLKTSHNEFASLSRVNNELVEREQIITHRIDGVNASLDSRFTGIQSALILRNIIIKLASLNDIATKSCIFKDTMQMTTNDVFVEKADKDIFTVKINFTGEGFLEDILVFICILEELDIGISISSFVATEMKEAFHKFSFSLEINGYYVVDIEM